MPTTWKEDTIARKLARRRNDDDQPVGGHKNKTKPCDWLIVYVSVPNRAWLNEWLGGYKANEVRPHGVIKIWGEYRSEGVAQRALERGQTGYRGYRSFYCHRSIYNLMLPYWREQ